MSGANREMTRAELLDALREVSMERDRLRDILNTPETADFLEAVRIESAHQRDRWGDEHDEQKSPEDWFWTIGYLAGKAIRPDATHHKRLHHIITTAAALANWHRIEIQRGSPGLYPPKEDEGA